MLRRSVAVMWLTIGAILLVGGVTAGGAVASSSVDPTGSPASYRYDGPSPITTRPANTRTHASRARPGPNAASRSSSSQSARRAAKAGDLTWFERRRIQKAVNAAGRPITVVGSAARGERRNRWKRRLPVGKEPGTRSDIDYAAPRSSLPYFDDQLDKLPGLDRSHGIIPGPHDPNIGPGIRFEPGG